MGHYQWHINTLKGHNGSVNKVIPLTKDIIEYGMFINTKRYKHYKKTLDCGLSLN